MQPSLEEALAVLRDEGLIDNAQEMGDYLMGRLERLESPHIKEVRGRGLLIGVELHESAGAHGVSVRH